MESTTKARRLLAVLSVLLVAASALAGVGFVGAADGETTASTAITGCTVIDQSGAYHLDSKLNGSGHTGPCLEVRASGVVIDGRDHTLAVDSEAIAIQSGAGANVTVRDMTIESSDYAIAGSPDTGFTLRDLDISAGTGVQGLTNVTDVTVRNLTIDAATGIRAGSNVTDVSMRSVTITNASRGVTTVGGLQNVTIRDLVVEQTTIGVYSTLASGSSTDVVVQNATMTGVTNGVAVQSSSNAVPSVSFALRNSTVDASGDAIGILAQNDGAYDVDLVGNDLNATQGDNGVEFEVVDNGTDVALDMHDNVVDADGSDGIRLNLERSNASTDLDLVENDVTVTGSGDAVNLQHSSSFGDTDATINVTARDNAFDAATYGLYFEMYGTNGSRDVDLVNNTIAGDSRGFWVKSFGANTTVDFTATDNDVRTGDVVQLEVSGGGTDAEARSTQSLTVDFHRNTVTDEFQVSGMQDDAPVDVSVTDNAFRDSTVSLDLDVVRDNVSRDVAVLNNTANGSLFVDTGGLDDETTVSVRNNTVETGSNGIVVDTEGDRSGRTDWASNQTTTVSIVDNVVQGTTGINVVASSEDTDATVTVADNDVARGSTTEQVLVQAYADDMTVDATVANNTVATGTDDGIELSILGKNTTATVTIDDNTVDSVARPIVVTSGAVNQTVDADVRENDVNVTESGGSYRDGIYFIADKNTALSVAVVDNEVDSTGEGIEIDPSAGEGNGDDPIDVELRGNVVNASTDGIKVHVLDSNEQVRNRTLTLTVDDNTVDAGEDGVRIDLANNYGTDDVDLVDNHVEAGDSGLSATLEAGEYDLDLLVNNNTVDTAGYDGIQLNVGDDSLYTSYPGTRDVNVSNNDVTADLYGIEVVGENRNLTVNATVDDNVVDAEDGVLVEVSADEMTVDAAVTANDLNVTNDAIAVEMYASQMTTDVLVEANVIEAGASLGIGVYGGTNDSATWRVRNNVVDSPRVGIDLDDVRMRDVPTFDVVVRGNDVTDASDVALSLDTESGTADGPGTLSVRDNDLHSTYAAVEITTGPVDGITITGNELTGSGFGVLNANTTAGAFVDATDNYWGTSDGPGSDGSYEDPVTGTPADGSGTTVSNATASVSNVHFDPFLSNPPKSGGVGNFTVAIASTNSAVTEGDALTVDVTVENTGSASDTQTVDVRVGALGSDSQSVSLDAGATKTVTLRVDTTVGDDGTYTATASSSNDSASTSVAVTERQTANFSVRIDSTNSPVEAGNDLAVTATVENVGNAKGTQTLELDGAGLGSDTESVTLAAGASQTVTFSIATSDGDAGDYGLSLLSENDSTITNVDVDEPSSDDPPTTTTTTTRTTTTTTTTTRTTTTTTATTTQTTTATTRTTTATTRTTTATTRTTTRTTATTTRTTTATTTPTTRTTARTTQTTTATTTPTTTTESTTVATTANGTVGTTATTSSVPSTSSGSSTTPVTNATAPVDGTTDSDGSTPGFGLVAAVAAIASAGLLVRRRT